jgi:hypothetical protein
MFQIIRTCRYEHIEKFAIYGERHCGTNFLESCIKCFNIHHTSFFGHKHWMGFAKLSKIRSEKHTIFFCIVRNPYDWLSAFYSLAHHVPKCNKGNFQSFLTNEWYSVDRSGREILHDRNFNTKQRYKNIFELRKTKIQYILDILPLSSENYVFLRYEDLVYNHHNILNTIKEKFFLKQIHTFPLPTFVRKRKISIEDKSIIDSNLDWSLENKLGYFQR